MAAVGVAQVLVAVVPAEAQEVPAVVAPVQVRAVALELVVAAGAEVAAGAAVVPAAVAVEAPERAVALEPVVVVVEAVVVEAVEPQRAEEQQAASLDTAVAHPAALRVSDKATLRAWRPASLMLLA